MATTVEHTTELAMKLQLSKKASDIEQAVTQPSLEELLAVSQGEFAATGMTEDQMMDFGREFCLKRFAARKLQGHDPCRVRHDGVFSIGNVPTRAAATTARHRHRINQQLHSPVLLNGTPPT